MMKKANLINIFILLIITFLLFVTITYSWMKSLNTPVKSINIDYTGTNKLQLENNLTYNLYCFDGEYKLINEEYHISHLKPGDNIDLKLEIVNNSSYDLYFNLNSDNIIFPDELIEYLEISYINNVDYEIIYPNLTNTKVINDNKYYYYSLYENKFTYDGDYSYYPERILFQIYFVPSKNNVEVKEIGFPVTREEYVDAFNQEPKNILDYYGQKGEASSKDRVFCPIDLIKQYIEYNKKAHNQS